MALERVAQNHYRQQATLVRDATDAVLQLWTQLGPDGYERQLERAAGVFAAGQVAAARQAADYVTAAAVAQGLNITDAPDVVARAFAGQTADGVPLQDVLRAPLIRLRAAQMAGASDEDALRSATATLARLVSNEVAQAGTNATAVAMIANPDLDGFVRLLTRPSCGRCAVLAGKWFKWNQGFDRHPGCDCVHVPAAEAQRVESLAADPNAYFKSLSSADQDRYFGKAEAEAIRSGSDLIRTVNATSRKSGLSSGSFSTKPTGGVSRVLSKAERTADKKAASQLLTDRGYVVVRSRSAALLVDEMPQNAWRRGGWTEVVDPDQSLDLLLRGGDKRTADLIKQARRKGAKLARPARAYRNGNKAVLIEPDDITDEQVASLLKDFDDALAALPPEVRDEAIDLVVPVGDKHFASGNHSYGYVWQGDDVAARRIHVSPKVVRGFQDDSDEQWFMPGAQGVTTLRWIVHHEMGHVLDNIRGDTRGIKGKDQLWVDQLRNLNKYASEAREETYAELFAEWVLGRGNAAAAAYAEQYKWGRNAA